MKCPYCGSDANLVHGNAVYPHRPDLFNLKFYQCKPCEAYVGCHKGTDNPLGILANKDTRMARSRAHMAFDPIWRSGKMARHEAYLKLSKFMGKEVSETHIGMFNNEECLKVVKFSQAYESR